MDLHHRYLVAGVVDVFVECDQPWLAGLDELNESRHAPALLLELSCLEPVGRDEDERRRHGAFLCRLVSPSMRWLVSPVAPVDQPASARNAFVSAANSLWCWKRKPWAESG